jgi:hypothetical protein
MTKDSQKQQRVQTRIIRGATMPTIYVEGVSQMVVGFPNSRLRLASIIERLENESGPEEHHTLACELVMPTSAMLEISQGILQNLAKNKTFMQQGGAEWMGKVQELFDSIPDISKEAKE